MDCFVAIFPHCHFDLTALNKFKREIVKKMLKTKKALNDDPAHSPYRFRTQITVT